ncbi:MAG: baeRF3 domain-containing protein [Candidatus Binatia bacterium]
MHSPINDYAAGIWSAAKSPCLSLYQPTHRHHPDNQQDPIRFRNLVKSLDQSLRQKYTTREYEPLLEPFQVLAEDNEFWNHTLDGLSMLGAPGLFRVYRLQRAVPELVVVADSFHIKPLMRIIQSADRYQVLGLNRREVKLYEGNRDALDEIELAEMVPRTIRDALGEELTEPHLTVASYGAGAGATAMRHGHGSKKDEVDIDAERFFRSVDRAILEHHSRPSQLPVILAALPEHHNLFRQVSQNPFLLAGGIDKHPDAFDAGAFRDSAWHVVEPQYLARLAGLVEQFGTAKSQGLGSDKPALVAEAAAAGRVATLLLEAERHIAGQIDPSSGRIEYGDLAHPEIDDILDDLGELVLTKGGQVVIVAAERMPAQSGVAAIYRY